MSEDQSRDGQTSFESRGGSWWSSICHGMERLRFKMETVCRCGEWLANNQPRTAEKGWSSTLEVGRGAKTSRRQNYHVMRC
jgi:hypothetical protein